MSKTPFLRNSWDWRWPQELDVTRDGTVATIASRMPSMRGGVPIAPDLRALTLLEAAKESVLAGDGPLEQVRVDLGAGWKGAKLAALAARVGFLRTHGFPNLSLSHLGRPIETPDPVAEWTSYFDATHPRTTRGGHEMELLALALDDWIGVVKTALLCVWDEAADADLGEIPWINLESDDRRIHPRLYAILDGIRPHLRIDAPGEAPPRSRGSALTARLEASCSSYREALGRNEGTRRKGDTTTYPFVLPREYAKEGVWKEIRGRLDKKLPRRHAFFHNLKSSQAFAANVFLGLEKLGLLGELARVIDGRLPTGTPTLELELGSKREFQTVLGEIEHQTQVDAVVFAETSPGYREAYLFEVKLTEPAFGACRGPRIADDAQRTFCASGTPEARRAGCFLAVKHRRKYLEHAAAFDTLVPALGADGGCPLRHDGYQLARNLVIARYLEGKIPGHTPPPAHSVARARFFVLSARETPALWNGRIEPLGTSPAERLEKLGVTWVDAAALIENLPCSSAKAEEFVSYMKQRYGPIFEVA